MIHRDFDELLERHLSGSPPGQVFRARVLLDSTAALARRRRPAGRWRMVWLSAAAVLIAGVSFLVGRSSVPSILPRPTKPVVAGSAETLAVPNELVAWLEAAQLYRRLGMQDRMARAVERAGRLLPRDGAVTSDAMAEPFLVAGDGVPDERSGSPGFSGAPNPYKSFDILNRVLAQSSGDYSHANGTN